MIVNKKKKALVVWYSQTGYTERIGKSLVKNLRNLGFDVNGDEYRNIEMGSISSYDFVVAGTPVYYYDVPENFRNWLSCIENIQDIPAAAFVTYGGGGGHQHNTGVMLLDILAGKGGVPVGMKTFGNMSSFSLAWSLGSSKGVLKYSHLPDDTVYAKVNLYAQEIVERIENNLNYSINKKYSIKDTFHNVFKTGPAIWGAKLFINSHMIDKGSCTNCGSCIKKCPVNAIDLEEGTVNTGNCIACLGCVNNCPANAVDMVYMGKEVTGYKKFIKENNIILQDP